MAFDAFNYTKIRGFAVPKSFRPAPLTDEAKEVLYGRITLPVAIAYMRFQGLDITVDGAEHMPVDGGAMVAVNHTGYFDFVYAGIPAFLNGRRLIRFMAKKEIFDNKYAGPLMRAMKHIEVDRLAGRGAYEEAVRRLRAGALVGIFPEATISRSFEIKEFKTGAARLADEAEVPLVPVTIFGSQRVWTKGRKKNLGRVNVPIWIRVGEPIRTTGDAAADTARLHDAMAEQLAALRADYIERYGDEPGAYWLPASLGGSAPTLEEADEMDEKERLERIAKRDAKLAREGKRPGGDGDAGDGTAPEPRER
ncbi:lysophospholipid acyltransferase family protein [Corynebacterium freneyi]|uniref:1-acyl-sn-glycerol-3-phosphate acyltransferase n=1 Tax=Corynebacterium freneyi TaxID=134034 RepID=A0ABS4U5H8_9CORY|nr:lysophospholipid acyltransferase family protein [Corynebacterium freneyi]MBP2331460.1 1-acyl-sn-glycerol-3-phosphate acyltransferase [Corynebacterium freneyi]QXA52065.1 1-acyl-sn-glycerol-3-phosphate acyltransferase [Corynebacterium freneyi]WJZ06416.1 1-acyl-sn-glycerol-3-phosphate acyltransferase [Corynebacterium freneyi]